MGVVQQFKDHPVPFILGLIISAFGTGIGVASAYPHLLTPNRTDDRKEELLFYVGTVGSQKLVERKTTAIDIDWETSCRALATDKLLKLGFTIANSESSRGTRGVRGVLSLVVVCQSNHNSIALVGAAPLSKYSELEAQAINLRAKMADAWPEFIITSQ